MEFGVLRGYMLNGPQYDQSFQGWVVYAIKPDKPCTAVEIRPA